MSQLFISDLDGTLLNDDASLHDKDIDRLNEFIEDNHFTVATGRSLVSTRKLLEKLNLKLPVITNNGSVISQINSNEPILVNSLSKELCLEVINFYEFHKLKYFVQTFCPETKCYKIYHKPVSTDGEKWYHQQRKSFGDRALQFKSYDFNNNQELPIQILIVDKTNDLQSPFNNLKAKISDYASLFLSKNPYLAEHSWLDVSAQNANKGYACEWMCKKINVSTDNLFVFGDGANDESMFKVAGHAFGTIPHYEGLSSLSKEILAKTNGNRVIDKMLQII